jgi:hypothetical protein
MIPEYLNIKAEHTETSILKSKKTDWHLREKHQFYEPEPIQNHKQKKRKEGLWRTLPKEFLISEWNSDPVKKEYIALPVKQMPLL